MTTPPPLSCLHWGNDGELALEDYLDLPMGLIDIEPDLRKTDHFDDLSTCKNITRANTRKSTDKTVEIPCTDHQELQEIKRNRFPIISVNIRTKS